MDHVRISHTPTDECPHRWPFVYLHGTIEKEVEYNAKKDIIPDIAFFSEPMPGFSGTYLGSYNDRPVVIHLDRTSNDGRACYLDDTKALKHVIREEDWR